MFYDEFSLASSLIPILYAIKTQIEVADEEVILG